MDDQKELEPMTYIEYKMHCYKQHKKPLNKNLTGPMVCGPQQLKYGAKRPVANVKEVFAFLAGADEVISKESVLKALETLRMPKKEHLKLFELIKADFIDFEAFCEIFE